MAELQAELARLQEDEASLADIMGELDEVESDEGNGGHFEDSTIPSEDAGTATLADAMGSGGVGPAAAAAAEAVLPPNDVPRGGVVALAGSSTPIGKSLLRAMFAADQGWSLRTLMRGGETLGAWA